MRRRTFRRRFKTRYQRRSKATGSYRKRRGSKRRYNLNSRGGLRL